MGSLIITASEVDASNASVMMMDPWFVTNDYFCHDGIDAITTFLWKTLARDQISFQSWSNHLICKNNLFINWNLPQEDILPLICGQNYCQLTSPVAQWAQSPSVWGEPLFGPRRQIHCMHAVSLLLNLGAAWQGRSMLFSDEQKLLFEGWKKGFVKNTKLDFMIR